jgi:hypothetical protein
MDPLRRLKQGRLLVKHRGANLVAKKILEICNFFAIRTSYARTPYTAGDRLGNNELKARNLRAWRHAYLEWMAVIALDPGPDYDTGRLSSKPIHLRLLYPNRYRKRHTNKAPGRFARRFNISTFKLRSAMPNEAAVVQFRHRLAQLLLRIHHDRPIPRYRLLDRLARHQQEPDSLGSSLHSDLVSAIEQH